LRAFPSLKVMPIRKHPPTLHGGVNHPSPSRADSLSGSFLFSTLVSNNLKFETPVCFFCLAPRFQVVDRPPSLHPPPVDGTLIWSSPFFSLLLRSVSLKPIGSQGTLPRFAGVSPPLDSLFSHALVSSLPRIQPFRSCSLKSSSGSALLRIAARLIPPLFSRKKLRAK